MLKQYNDVIRAVPRALQLGGGVNSKIYRRNPLKNRTVLRTACI
jgi:hypothetical protein